MQARVWLQLRISATCISPSRFAAMVARLGGLGTAEEASAETGEAALFAWFAPGDDMRRLRARIAAACMLQGIPADAVAFSRIGTDWETAWQRDWRPMPVGESLYVRPSFCAPPVDGRLDIVLDPGMAFGTGQHATTRLCLTAIERLCAKFPLRRMLDMGCGSGLLAIAAARLGVREVLAIDKDAHAVEAAARNARINHVDVHCRHADMPPPETFDLVVANILARPLLQMAEGLAASTNRFLVLSGLLAEQAEAVRTAYEHYGLHAMCVETEQEWVAIVFRGRARVGAPRTEQDI